MVAINRGIELGVDADRSELTTALKAPKRKMHGGVRLLGGNEVWLLTYLVQHNGWVTLNLGSTAWTPC